MSPASAIKSLLSSVDIIGLNIGLRHHNRARYNTVPGGILTIMTAIFITYCVFYFGEDLYHKAKPISRFNKILNNTMPIQLQNYQVPITFLNGAGSPIQNMERYVDISASWLLFDYAPLGLSGITNRPLIVERCTKEHVVAYGDLYLKDSFFDFSYCLNHGKFINGTTVQQGSPFIQGEYSTMNSSLVYYRIKPCVNSTGKCAPQSEIDTVLTKVNIAYSYVDAYVNLDNYETPYSYYLARNIIAFNRQLGKTVFMKVKSTVIQTDSGILMDDVGASSLLQAEPPTTDIVGDPNTYFHLLIVSTKIQDTYVRKNIKVQDIVANVGGLLKFLLTLGTVLLIPYQQRSFKFEIINNLYKINQHVEIKNQKADLAEISQKPIDLVDISQKPADLDNSQKVDLTRNNYMGRTTDLSSKELMLSFMDYTKALFGCSYKYSKKQYNHLIEFVNRKFEFITYIKVANTAEFLAEALVSNSQKQKLKDKFSLRWANDRVISNLDDIII
jgi:hypothetical protein